MIKRCNMSKKDKNREPKGLRELHPDEMLSIRGGRDKPIKPKSPGEIIILNIVDEGM